MTDVISYKRGDKKVAVIVIILHPDGSLLTSSCAGPLQVVCQQLTIAQKLVRFTLQHRHR